MTAIALITNKNEGPGVLIPDDSIKVKEAMQICAEKSQGSCFTAHFVATAYAIKGVAISFFNAFVYAARGLGRSFICLITCQCKNISQACQDFKSAGMSFLFTAICSYLVFFGFFFPKAAFHSFAKKKEELDAQSAEDKSKTALLGPEESQTKRSEAILDNKGQNQVISTPLEIKPGKEKPKSRLENVPDSIMQFGILSFLDKKARANLAVVSSTMKKAAYEQIKEIRFPEYVESILNDCFFPNAETLEIEVKDFNDPRLEKLALAVEKGKLPKIKHLKIKPEQQAEYRLESLDDNELNNLPIFKLVRSLSNLEKLTYVDPISILRSRSDNKLIQKLISNSKLKHCCFSHQWLGKEIFKQFEKHGSRIERLDLQDVYQIEKESFEAIAKGCPNLREIHYYFYYPKYYGRSLNFVSHLLPMKGRCKKVEILDLPFTEITQEGIDLINSWKLKSLRLIDAWNIKCSHLSEILSHQPLLQDLDLGFCNTLEGSVTLNKPHHLKNLRLFRCSDLKSKDLVDLVSHLPDLETLDIDRCFELNDSVLDALGKYCPKLRSLKICLVGKIYTQNAVDTLQAKNPKLKISTRNRQS